MKCNPTLKIYQNPLIEPLDLDEVKNYLKIENTEDDSLISSLIVTVRQSAENFLKLSLINQSWATLFDNYLPQTVSLLKAPVQAISSVVLYDKQGVSITIDSSQYSLNSARNKIIFDSSHISYKSEIIYVSGFGANKEDIPSPIKQAMLMHIASIYDNRAGGDTIPDYAKSLYSPFRSINL